MKRIFPFLAATTIIAASFGAFFFFGHNTGPRIGQVFSSDPAEYRYTAEYFWGIPHDLSSYDPTYFTEQWRAFLEAVPFRGIATGTAYILADSISKDAPLLLTLALRVALAAAYLLFFAACKKRFGTGIALVALALTLLPFQTWEFTTVLVTEPFARVCFLLLAAIVVRRGGLRFSLVELCSAAALCIVLVQLKSQWLLFTVLLCIAIALSHFMQKKTGAALLTLALFFLVPVSLALVNFIGWNTLSLNSGIGMHAVHKRYNATMELLCNRPLPLVDVPDYDCSIVEPREWLRVAELFPLPTLKDNMQQLDAKTMALIFADPVQALGEFSKGVFLSKNFPFVPRPWNLLLFPLDMLCLLVLACGVLRKNTWHLGFLGLILWLVPAVGMIFAVYDDRYHIAMAGLPLALALLIGMQTKSSWHRLADTI